MIANKCLVCGSSNLRADRALSGRLVCNSCGTPFGARGAGESPIAAGISAVCQAVYNATGVWIDMPMTPERVYTELKKQNRIN